uniref:Uncharacterized protein n=1 Tax=Cucumis melo TaxID=3656 RepID=A0A9I9E300_CUCME
MGVLGGPHYIVVLVNVVVLGVPYTTLASSSHESFKQSRQIQVQKSVVRRLHAIFRSKVVGSPGGGVTTWEPEYQMKKSYPILFSSTTLLFNLLLLFGQRQHRLLRLRRRNLTAPAFVRHGHPFPNSLSISRTGRRRAFFIPPCPPTPCHSPPCGSGAGRRTPPSRGAFPSSNAEDRCSWSPRFQADPTRDSSYRSKPSRKPQADPSRAASREPSRG